MEDRYARYRHLRLDWPDRWVHVRSSNTEPLVRLIAEATDPNEAAALAQEVTEQLQQLASTPKPAKSRRTAQRCPL